MLDAEFDEIEEAFQEALDASLEPRGPDSLFELVETLGVPRGGVAVDVGCGDGRDAIELATRFGLRVLGIDPAPRAASREGVEFRVGRAEQLDVADASVDLVWCKEVLMFCDLSAACREFARVLKPGGSGLIYQVCTGPRMGDSEAREFWEVDVGYGQAHSVRPDDLASALAAAGLEVTRRDDFGSEWGEFAQERSGAGGRRLLHAARLLRDPSRYIERFGETNYRIMLGDCHWHVYRMLGKLYGVAFVFRKERSA